MYTIEQKTARAAILVQSRSALVLDTISLPQQLDYGQVLVQVLYSGICGSQLGEIDARKGEDHYLPHLLGHEAAAKVVQCGPGVRHVHPGDLVVLHWRKGLGIDAAPPAYLWQGRKLNAGWVTTFNDYAVISENRMTPVPADTPPHLLPLFGCALTTGFGAVVNNAKVKLGEAVVVLGAGGVGLNIVQAAALSGAFPIIAVDLYDNRLELAKRLGATHTVNGTTTDTRKAITDILASVQMPQGADVCIDNTGQSQCIAMAYALTHSRGRTVCVGVPAQVDATTIYTLPLHFGKSITGSHGGETIPHEDIPRYLRLAQSKNIDLDILISETHPLEEINTAIDKMRSGEVAGRCLITF